MEHTYVKPFLTRQMSLVDIHQEVFLLRGSEKDPPVDILTGKGKVKLFSQYSSIKESGSARC